MTTDEPGPPLPAFDDPALADRVDGLSAAAVDALPFGAVRLDSTGGVALFNATEAALSGYGSRPTFGLDFFTQIAPCMNHPGFRGRIGDGLASGRLNLHFTWTGNFSDRDRQLEIRILGRPGGGAWLFIRREE